MRRLELSPIQKVESLLLILAMLLSACGTDVTTRKDQSGERPRPELQHNDWTLQNDA